VYSVFLDLWIYQYRRLPPDEFNEIFDFLVIFRLHLLLSLFAEAYQRQQIFFTCIWDSSKYRPLLKELTERLRNKAHAEAQVLDESKVVRDYQARMKKEEKRDEQYNKRRLRKGGAGTGEGGGEEDKDGDTKMRNISSDRKQCLSELLSLKIRVR